MPLAPYGEMESDTCCEETMEPVAESTEAVSGPADNDKDNNRTENEQIHESVQEHEEAHWNKENEPESQCGGSECTGRKTSVGLPKVITQIKREDGKTLEKKNSWKTVRFVDPAITVAEEERDSSAENLFSEYETEEWTSSTFEELFVTENWEDLNDERLLRKKVLKPGLPDASPPAWGQEVTVRMQGVVEDHTVVERDCKLVFVIGEGDVNQALEECAMTMQRDEIALLLADSQFAYGHCGREPDIPPWAPLLYQLQLLDVRDKPDPLALPVPDRIRIGNQKRERGNFYFQREEYAMAARAYCMALRVLVTCTKEAGNDGGVLAGAEEEEVKEYRVKSLNNLAAAQLKLEQYDDALNTSRDVLLLEPNNVKALFRTGKILADKNQNQEAMELLKKALKLEPATKAIHVELSKLVQKQSGGCETQKWKAKPAQFLGEDITPFLFPSKKKPPGMSWTLLLGALVVALGSLVTSVILTARN